MSPRRLCALVAGLRSYKDTATYLQDRPDWTRQDEWSALTIEQLAHWLPLQVLALVGGKTKLPPPQPLFKHPDRPGAKAKEPSSDASEIGRFFKRHISGGG
jgi:hypothetical protein